MQSTQASLKLQIYFLHTVNFKNTIDVKASVKQSDNTKLFYPPPPTLHSTQIFLYPIESILEEDISSRIYSSSAEGQERQLVMRPA